MLQVRAFLLPILVVFGFLVGVPAIAQIAVDAGPKIALVALHPPDLGAPMGEEPPAPVLGGTVTKTETTPQGVTTTTLSSPLWGPFIAQIIQWAWPLVLGFFGWLFALLRTYIKSHVKNVRAAGILIRVADSVETRTRAMGQTYVDVAKANGTFGPAEAKQANAQVVEQVKSDLAPTGLLSLAKDVGVGDVEGYLVAKVEAQVHAIKPPPPPVLPPIIIPAGPMVTPPPDAAPIPPGPALTPRLLGLLALLSLSSALSGCALTLPQAESRSAAVIDLATAARKALPAVDELAQAKITDAALAACTADPDRIACQHRTGDAKLATYRHERAAVLAGVDAAVDQVQDGLLAAEALGKPGPDFGALVAAAFDAIAKLNTFIKAVK